MDEMIQNALARVDRRIASGRELGFASGICEWMDPMVWNVVYSLG